MPPRYQASARIAFFDAAVERYLVDMDPLVILGAGFDTRAFRLPKDGRRRAFEVDTPKTQALKREMVKAAGLDSARVTFVAADFEKEDWLERLVDAGFDAGNPALFLWEGVMLYLAWGGFATAVVNGQSGQLSVAGHSRRSRPYSTASCTSPLRK